MSLYQQIKRKSVCANYNFYFMFGIRNFQVTSIYLGGVHMKNQPCLTWKLKEHLTVKNKLIRDRIKSEEEAGIDDFMFSELKKIESDPNYIYDPNPAKLKKWHNSRKRIVMSRLFGPCSKVIVNPSTADIVSVEATSL